MPRWAEHSLYKLCLVVKNNKNYNWNLIVDTIKNKEMIQQMSTCILSYIQRKNQKLNSVILSAALGPKTVKWKKHK